MSPYQFYPGNVTVSVSLNGIDWTNNSISYYYQADATPLKVYPPYGVVEGNTVVTVTGENFEANMKCRFDGIEVLATVFNVTTLLCTTPAHGFGDVELDVTTNDAHFSQSKVRFI